MGTGSLFLGIDSSRGIDSAMEFVSSEESISPFYEKFLSDTLRKRERAHVLDEKSILASKTEVSWAVGNSVFHSAPTWILLSS
jgi:hypothetical protein